MPNKNDVLWFKENFGAQIQAAVVGTPFSVDLLTAIACQETGYMWQKLRLLLPVERVLELCVGDVLNYNPDPTKNSRSKSAFPNNRAQLVAVPHGQKMYQIARESLVEMAKYIGGYAPYAENPERFCHAFSIFQYDIQFFLKDPDFFLQRQWLSFEKCLEKCLQELHTKLKRLGYHEKAQLTDLEQCHVGIAYNKGSFDPAKGLKQGFKPKGAHEKYYGEKLWDFFQLAKSVNPTPGVAVVPPANLKPGLAILPAPSPLAAAGPRYEVNVQSSLLNLRATPAKTGAHYTGKVLHKMPDGLVVQAVGTPAVNKMLEVETSVQGALKRGWAHTDYLQPLSDDTTILIEAPLAAPATAGLQAAHALYAEGQIVKRTQPAGARSLNEAKMPRRTGKLPAELAADLGRIIEYLAVDRPSHSRYQPGSGKTYCNIYAHDYCHLAGVYLPRVWWKESALKLLLQGEQVVRRVDNTVEEVRANALLSWLQSWGPEFGWRQTGTLTKLQDAANQGAVALIVARRKVDGRSGHIVAVVPETAEHQAKRNAGGEVLQPLESQAGETNYQYVVKSRWWWTDPQFAEHAFWVHA